MYTLTKKHLFAAVIFVCFVMGFVSIANAEYGIYEILHHFTGGAGDGSRPYFTTPISDGNVLYGMTELGGSNNYGVIFKINRDGSGYTNLHEFADGVNDGRESLGSLLLLNDKLYGMTREGGYTVGVIFRIDTDGNNYTNLHNFAGGLNDGRYPLGGLTLSSTSNTFYGMTSYGGASDKGVIFKMDIDGSNYTNLHAFSNDDDNGCGPWGNVTLSGNTLYGMTRWGGSNDLGVIFKMNTDGSNYTNLHEFAGGGDDGSTPWGDVTLSGSSLFGMTPLGGSSDYGVVFKIDSDGSGYTNLHEFPASITDGSSPYGSLILSNSLFGMTYLGGAIFKMDTDGSNYTNLHRFTGGIYDGAGTFGSLLNVDDEFHGMTQFGGVSNLGVVFVYSEIPEPSLFIICPLLIAIRLGIYYSHSRM